MVENISFWSIIVFIVRQRRKKVNLALGVVSRTADVVGFEQQLERVQRLVEALPVSIRPVYLWGGQDQFGREAEVVDIFVVFVEGTRPNRSVERIIVQMDRNYRIATWGELPPFRYDLKVEGGGVGLVSDDWNGISHSKVVSYRGKKVEIRY